MLLPLIDVDSVTTAVLLQHALQVIFWGSSTVPIGAFGVLAKVVWALRQPASRLRQICIPVLPCLNPQRASPCWSDSPDQGNRAKLFWFVALSGLRMTQSHYTLDVCLDYGPNMGHSFASLTAVFGHPHEARPGENLVLDGIHPASE